VLVNRNFFLGVVSVGIAFLIGNVVVRVPSQLEVMAIIALLLIYPVVRYPTFGLYVGFGLVPFVPYFRKLYYLKYDRPEIDPLIAVGDVILFFICIGLFFSYKQQVLQTTLVKKFSRIILGYFCYVAVRTVVFNELANIATIAEFKNYGPMVLYFFIGIYYAKEHNVHKTIWKITLVISVVAALYGIGQLLWGYSEAERAWFTSAQFTSLFIGDLARPFSFFQAPVIFADYCFMGICAVLVLSADKRLFSVPLRLLVISLLIAGIVITSVRSNWIGTFLLVYLWWFHFNHKQSWKIKICIVLLFICSVGAFEFIKNSSPNTGIATYNAIQVEQQSNIDVLLQNRVEGIINPLQEHSVLSRLQLWWYLIRLTENPMLAILGRGIGVLKADSLYFTYLAELGYPGLLFIVALLSTFVFLGLRAMKRAHSQHEYTLFKMTTIITICMAVMSITGTHIHTFPGDMYFWFFNGVLIKNVSDSQDTAHT